MNRQEIYDKVKAHLLTQGKKSEAKTISGQCLYRSPDGLQCAAGCLIPDELYDPEMEGARVPKCAEELLSTDSDDNDTRRTAMIGNALVKAGINVRDVPFIERLQRIHDHFSPDCWSYELHRLAYTYSLVA